MATVGVTGGDDVRTPGHVMDDVSTPGHVMDDVSTSRYFHVVDYVVFVLMFVFSLSIGAFFAFRGRHKNTTDEYLMGGRKLGLLPVTISICVSVVSANTLLGAPAEMYTYGIMYQFVCIPIIISTIIVTIWFVPLLYPLKITSAHKYLYMRFHSKTVQFIGTLFLLLTQSLYIGCVIFGPATALETVTGIPSWASIILVSVIGTAYTTFGGMKAVIWTDVFQSGVMIAGLLAMIIQGSNKLGGFSKIWEVNRDMGRLDLNLGSSMTDRFTFYSVIIGFTTYWVGGYGVNQPCMQRYCAMETQWKGRLAMMLNGPGFITFTTLSTMAGMVAFAYYDTKGCDPLAAGIVANGNQLTPYFVMEILGYPGLPGLFVSSLFSGSLSTFSSSINSMSAVVWEDVLEERYASLSDPTKTRITKGLSLLFGMLCMGVAFIVMSIGGNLIQLAASFFGVAIGPLLGIFTLGALIPWANWIGAVGGAIVGMGVNLWLLMGQTFTKSQRLRLPSKTFNCPLTANQTTWTTANHTWATTPLVWTTTTEGVAEPASMSGLTWLYSISFSWYPFIGFFLVVVFGAIISAISLCFGKRAPVEKRLLFTCLQGCGSHDDVTSNSMFERSDSFKMEKKIPDVTSI